MDILEQFGINPLLLTAQVVNFLILLFIMRKFLYGPIVKVLEDRKKKIEDSLKGAREIERRLTEIGEKETEAILNSAKEGEKLVKEAVERGNQIIDEANKEAERVIIKATRQAETIMISEREKLQREVKENIADLIFLVLQKATGKVLTKQDQKKIVETSIKELE